MANDTAMNMDRPGTGAELKVRPQLHSAQAHHDHPFSRLTSRAPPSFLPSLKVRPGDRCLICFFSLSLPFSLVLENRRLLGPVVAERQARVQARRMGKGWQGSPPQAVTSVLPRLPLQTFVRYSK